LTGDFGYMLLTLWIPIHGNWSCVEAVFVQSCWRNMFSFGHWPTIFRVAFSCWTLHKYLLGFGFTT